MDVRLHRASKTAALTLMIILTTALVSVWLNNPPPPISWEMYGRVSYSDAFFDIEIPASLNITYNAEVDDFQNTTRIYVEINTELMMTRGLLTFEMVSSYITPHSWYSIADSREATLSSSSSSEYWNTTSYHNLPFTGLTYDGSNESYEQNSVFRSLVSNGSFRYFSRLSSSTVRIVISLSSGDSFDSGFSDVSLVIVPT